MEITHSYKNAGWWCHNCDAYHSPSTHTCPNAGEAPSPKVPAEPYQYPYPYPSWPYPSDLIQSCPKCGITLSRVMGYVCINPGCPTGLGGATYLTEG